MTKRQIYRIIEWSVAIAACGYLIWRLATYEDYASLAASLRAMGWKEWGALVLCVALMPVNMAIEAWRWYSLMNEGVRELGNEGMKELKNERVKELKNERLTFREAQRQVYYSKLAGLITPWRLGEYPSRAILMAQEIHNSQFTMHNASESKDSSVWPQVLSMGAVGSATMTFAIVLAGARWCCDVAVGGWIGIGAEVIEAMGYGVTWVDFEERGTEFGAVDLLVCATHTRALCTRSGYRLRVMGYGRTLFRLLSAGDDNAECADSGSGRTRRMGDSGVWYSKCCVGGSDLMGHKYVIALSDLAFFTQKTIIYLHICKKSTTFVAGFFENIKTLLYHEH